MLGFFLVTYLAFSFDLHFTRITPVSRNFRARIEYQLVLHLGSVPEIPRRKA